MGGFDKWECAKVSIRARVWLDVCDDSYKVADNVAGSAVWVVSRRVKDRVSMELREIKNRLIRLS